jgi:spore maturation protein CgeB
VTFRILAVGDLWQGSNAYAYVRAFRRAGHSVRVLAPENYVPSAWASRPLKAVRRTLEPLLVREYAKALLSAAANLRPHLFFVFKGRYVDPDVVRRIKAAGAVAVNFFPDVSFMAHGPLIPQALPHYDWVFTAKTFGVNDMRHRLGVESASVLPHGYDPEVHAPVELDAEDRHRYECDVSFVGTWSPKKQSFLEKLVALYPGIRLRVWGYQWEPAHATLRHRVEREPVLGIEYAKAMLASRINLCILSEARRGSSSGDRTTSRTFHIPATGAFMLHERTDELATFFRESSECGCFGLPEEMATRVEYFLRHDDERTAMARAGRERCLSSGYSIDARASELLRKVAEINAHRHPTPSP